MDLIVRHHPKVNAALFALQLAVNFNQNAFTPKEKEPKPWTWSTLIQPAGVAFLIWLVIYIFTTASVAIDLFVPHLSLFNDHNYGRALRWCFTASCVFNTSWIVLFNWLRWIHVAAFDLAAMWATLLPIYLYSSHMTAVGQVSWQQFVFSHLAFRIYFSWVSAAVMLNITISWQAIHGGFLSFPYYGGALAVLLTVVLTGIVYCRDHVIAGVATWALFWLTKRASTYTGETHEAFAKVQAGAFIALIVVALMTAIMTLHRHFETKWIGINSSDLVKPLLDH